VGKRLDIAEEGVRGIVFAKGDCSGRGRGRSYLPDKIGKIGASIRRREKEKYGKQTHC